MFIGIKAILTGAFVFNLLLMMTVYPKQSEGPLTFSDKVVSVPFFEDAPRPPWYESEPWKEYTDKLQLQKEVDFANEDNYCQKVEEYRKAHPIKFDSKGIPIWRDRNTCTDYQTEQVPRQVLQAYTNMTYKPKIANQKVHPPFSPAYNLFFVVKSRWHVNHLIEKHFLCKGQRYNHIPGIAWINYKDLTANMFREYANYYKGREHCFDPWKIMPYTLDLTQEDQCREFLSILEKERDSSEINWMIKKSRYAHNGKGVDVLDKQTKEEFLIKEECPWQEGYLAQWYIADPMLIEGHKFDFRAYMFIASMDPLIILYHDGFVRMSMTEWDPESNDKTSHLTNIKVAKASMESKNLTPEQQKLLLEDQGWSYAHFENYMLDKGVVYPGWMENVMKKKIKLTMFHIVRMNLDKLLRHPRVFELMGMDFLVDNNLNVWYIEANLSPSISATSQEKKKLNSDLMRGVIDVEYALEYGADLDTVLRDTQLEVVFDGRKPGMERYAGLLEEECL